MLVRSSRERAQGRPGAGCTHGPRATKKHAAEPQVQPGQPGLPCAMVLRLIRDLPGDRAFLPPSPRRCRRILARSGSARIAQGLAPASGRQDHTTSPSALASLVLRANVAHENRPAIIPARAPPSRPSHSQSSVRDDAYAPHQDRNANTIWLMLALHEAIYFSRDDWTARFGLAISIFGAVVLDCRKAATRVAAPHEPYSRGGQVRASIPSQRV